MGNNHVTTLEIDLNAVKHNLNYFKSKIDSTTKTLVVLKAFGYGTSAIEIGKYVSSMVDYFAVAYLDEGIALRKAGITNPILVLHPQKKNLEKIISFDLEPNIYSMELLNSIINILKEKRLTDYSIHLKFNTGLNRLGFTNKEVSNVTSIVNSNEEIRVASVFSHIAASEDLSERAYTLHQINTFNEIYAEIVSKMGYTPLKHMLNTSGILNYTSEAQFDMVRLGIGLYGFGNDASETEKLENVITLKSVISQIHTIEEGETVGYNRSFKASSTMKTATIPIGHADGISRQLGNGVGYIYVKNEKAPIVGNVCMDMIMVDISNSKNSKEGDEVVIYKNQQHIEHLAALTKTISYELLTAISQRINRTLKKC